LTGGGKRPKNHLKSIYYLSNIFKELKYFTSYIATFLTPQREEKLLNSKGIVLIEFAICMPILIILLFYINDLMRIKRYYSQTEFVAQQFANIIQNISQKREGVNRKITLLDIRYAASLAFLSIYPGTTMFADGKRGNQSHELSHRPEFRIYYIKGLSEGKASVRWGWNGYCTTSTSPKTWQGGRLTSDVIRSSVRWRANTDASNIYPTLKINDEKDKIILECFVYNNDITMSLNAHSASDDQNSRAKKAFNFQLLNPKAVYADANVGHYFNSVVIFTPKPGLFDETPPS